MSPVPVPSPLRGFAGTITRSRPSVLYQLGLAVVAVVMVLLPAIYVGLILLVGWGVWYHATNDFFILQGAGGSWFTAAALLRPDPRGARRDPLHGETAVCRPPAGAAGDGPRREAGAAAVRLHRAHLPAGRGPPAAPRGGQLRGQRRGELPPGRGQPLRPGHDADHRPAPRGGAEHEAVCRRARPRVRALLPGRRHEAHLRDPPDQRLVLPGGVRARPLGHGAGGAPPGPPASGASSCCTRRAAASG